MPSTDAAGNIPVPYEYNGVAYGAATNDSTTHPPQTNSAVWWPDFLAKFLGSTKGGQGDQYGGGAMTSAESMSLSRKSVFWCPAWAATGALLSVTDNQPLYTGYSMNYMVTVTPGLPLSPTRNGSPSDFANRGDSGGPSDLNARLWLNVQLDKTQPLGYDSASGTWYQLSRISMADQRCFMADATTLFLECWQAPNEGCINSPANFIPPPQNVFSTSTAGQTAYSASGSTGQNSFDNYRHGVYPPLATGWKNAGGSSFSGTCFAQAGGKVAYNILYFDGHVQQCNDRTQAYRSIRMRYPN